MRSAAMTEPVHSLRISWDCSVMPFGQPNRQNSLFGTSHPVRVTPPRRPSAASRASLLPRATARCLLVLRPGAPDGPPSGTSTGTGLTASPPITVWGETSRLRSAADHRRRPTGGSHAGRTARPAARPPHAAGRRRSTVRVGAVYSRLLTPKWLLLHVLVAVLFVATFFLGYWQLTKAEAGGGAVNWSYALQWPLYGFMGLWFYLRMVRIELHRDPDDGAPGRDVVLYQRPRIDTSGDPELAAYNAYLAELNERALGQQSSPRGR